LAVSPVKLAMMTDPKVVRASERFAENRRRRERGNRSAADWEFAAFVRRFPRPVVMAVLKAAKDRRPDALALLPSPWRERALAAWHETMHERSTRRSVVPFRPPAAPTSVVD
jgi:hypothetical protein